MEGLGSMLINSEWEPENPILLDSPRVVRGVSSTLRHMPPRSEVADIQLRMRSEQVDKLAEGIRFPIEP